MVTTSILPSLDILKNREANSRAKRHGKFKHENDRKFKNKRKENTCYDDHFNTGFCHFDGRSALS